MADQGTLFLDEIGEMPRELQVKILRVMEEQKFQRVGGTEEIEVDNRILAATNKDLKQAVEAGSFREDLYYRLKVITISISSPERKKRRYSAPSRTLFSETPGHSGEKGQPGERRSPSGPKGLLLAGKCPGAGKCPDPGACPVPGGGY